MEKRQFSKSMSDLPNASKHTQVHGFLIFFELQHETTHSPTQNLKAKESKIFYMLRIVTSLLQYKMHHYECTSIPFVHFDGLFLT